MPVTLTEVPFCDTDTLPPNAGSAVALEIAMPETLTTERTKELICALDPEGLSFVIVAVTMVSVWVLSGVTTAIDRLKCLFWAAPRHGSANAARAATNAKPSNLRIAFIAYPLPEA